MVEHKVYELGDDSMVELKMAHKEYPYKEMLAILARGNTFFMALDRRSARYARTRLERELGELLETSFCVYTTPEGKKLDGYTFGFKMAADYFKKVHEEDKNE